MSDRAIKSLFLNRLCHHKPELKQDLLKREQSEAEVLESLMFQAYRKSRFHDVKALVNELEGVITADRLTSFLMQHQAR